MLYYHKGRTKLKLVYVFSDEACLVLKDDYFGLIGQIIHSNLYIHRIKNSGFYQLLDVIDVDVL